jgi:hypothetical protein
MTVDTEGYTLLHSTVTNIIQTISYRHFPRIEQAGKAEELKKWINLTLEIKIAKLFPC